MIRGPVSPGGRRHSFIALLFVVTLAWPALASAEKKRVGIPRFEGQQEALIRKVVMQVIKGKGFELVRSREIEDAAKKGGVSLDSNDGFATLSKELALSAIVTGEVGKKKVKLTVRNGADGSVSGDGAFAGANPKKLAVEVAKTFWRRLGSAVERGRVPSGAKKPSKGAAAAAPEDDEDDKEAAAAVADKGDDKEEKDDKDKDKDKDKESAKSSSKSEEKASEPVAEEAPRKKRKRPVESDDSSEGGGSVLRALDLSVGMRVFSRKLTYKDDVRMALRPYALTAPALGLGVLFYPGALGSSSGPLANIGLEADGELAFGIKSKTKTGASYPTTVHDLAGGLRYRIPFGGGELGIFTTVGEHAFKLSSAPGAPRSALNDLPDTIYRYVRVGVSGRAGLGKVSLFGGAAYRYILTPGQIKDDYFKRLSVGGVDFNAGLGLALTSAIELRAGVDVRRYFYNFHVQAGDMFIAGGAIDQYVTGTFMVAFTLDGSNGK